MCLRVTAHYACEHSHDYCLYCADGQRRLSTRAGRPIEQMRCRGSGVARGDMDFPWLCVECNHTAPEDDGDRFDAVIESVQEGHRRYIVRQDEVNGSAAVPLRPDQIIAHSTAGDIDGTGPAADGNSGSNGAHGMLRDLLNDVGVVATASPLHEPGPPLFRQPRVSYDERGRRTVVQQGRSSASSRDPEDGGVSLRQPVGAGYADDAIRGGGGPQSFVGGATVDGSGAYGASHATASRGARARRGPPLTRPRQADHWSRRVFTSDYYGISGQPTNNEV